MPQRYRRTREEDKVYQMQVRDRACTICIYAWVGGKVCKECQKGDKLNWKEESRTAGIIS